MFKSVFKEIVKYLLLKKIHYKLIKDSVMKNNNRRIDGRFWFTNNGEYFAGRGRIELLKHIKETGSIAQAAKVMGMSYKAAWDSVDTMNKMTGQALVLRTSGGRHGGGSKITEAGLEFIERYDKYTETFEKFFPLLILTQI